MSSTKPDRISTSTPPRRTFALGAGDSALDDNDTTPVAAASRLGRMSFGQSQHRSSFAARWRGVADEEGRLTGMPTSERPPIPSALQPSGEPCTTPLPVLSMTVLSIVSSASVYHLISPHRLPADYAWRVSFCECLNTVFVVHGER
jgi:hypothetical protein